MCIPLMHLYFFVFHMIVLPLYTIIYRCREKTLVIRLDGPVIYVTITDYT